MDEKEKKINKMKESSITSTKVTLKKKK